ncbi:MAG: hypothetical protein U0905_17165 [Pirellulales bacterium]
MDSARSHLNRRPWLLRYSESTCWVERDGVTCHRIDQIGFVLLFFGKPINPKWQFKLIVADNSITYSQGLPASSRGKIESFF